MKMKKLIISVLLSVFGLPLLAQADRIDSLLFDVLENDRSMKHLFDQPSKYSYFYSGINIDNKTFYAGRELGDDMYSAIGNLYYFHSSGLFLGASGSWFSQTYPKYGSTIVTAGLRKPLNRKNKLNVRISYSRFFFNIPDTSVYIPYSNIMGAGLVFNNNWIGGSLSFNFLFGEETGMNMTPSVFSNLTISRFGKTGKILLSPEVSAFIGSETITGTGSLYDSASSAYITKENYGLLNIQMTLPLGIYFSGIGIQAGYSVNVPRTRDIYIKYPANSYVTLTISYALILK
jgi:hypothetical protein